MTTSPPTLLTIPDAGAQLRASRWLIYELNSSGALHATDVATTGRPKTRIRLDDLQAFIDRRTSRAPRRALTDASPPPG